jgi:hypothetical protein
MRLVEIDVIGLEALERALDRRGPVLSSMSSLIPYTAIESISTRPTSAGHTGHNEASHPVVPKPEDGSSSSPPSRRAKGTGAFPD